MFISDKVFCNNHLDIFLHPFLFRTTNGNTISVTKGSDVTVNTWDDRGRLIKAVITTSAGTKTVEYKYNSTGIRVISIDDGVETRYLIDENRDYAQVLEEYKPDGTVIASYVYGHDLISENRNGVKSFYIYDGLGSTRALTNAAGTVTDSYNYDAYGTLLNSTGSTANSYRFAGEQFDSNLGQYYLRDRYYSTGIGRFTRSDSYQGNASNPVSLHKYLYANGNPISFVDPSGRFSLAEISAAESIRNSLANLQINSYGYLLSASMGGGSYKIGDFGIEFGTNAFFALAPIFAPFAVKGATNIFRSLRGAGGNGLPPNFKNLAINEIVDSSAVIAQTSQLSCGPACGSMLLRDLNVNVSQRAIAEAVGTEFLNKEELVMALTRVDPSATRSWYANALTNINKRNIEVLSNNGSWAAQIGDGWYKHWVVVDGYDASKNLLKIRDPSGSKLYSLTLEDFRTLSTGAVVYPH